MTQDGLLVLQTLFTTIWSLFTCFEIPGTHATPAEWAVFCLFFALILRSIPRLFDLASDADKLKGRDEP